MKTIVDDPEGFFDQGGWSFLDPESDAENGEDEDEDEEDDQYAPTDSEPSEEEDSGDDESEFEEEESEMEYSGKETVTSRNMLTDIFVVQMTILELVRNLVKIGPNLRKRLERLTGITMSTTKYRIKRKEHLFRPLNTGSRQSRFQVPSTGHQERTVPPLLVLLLLKGKTIITTNIHLRVKSLKSN